MNQNTSVMDSQGGQNQQAQSRSELVDDQSVGTKNENTTKEKYQRMINVFKMLIAEAPYLVDDKAAEMCEGQDAKEQFKIKIDSIRKSLGIEDMGGVELLVEVLYRYQDEYDAKMEEEQRRMEEEELEEQENGVNGEANHNSINEVKKTSNEPTMNGAPEAAQASRDEEEVDENMLRLQPELLTEALQKFHREREERDLKRDMLNQKNKKKSKDSKSTDKARDASREKKKEKMYWAQMTKILTDQKLSVWRALDKALTKYYQLLVDRQNLIEETGLLNQQNEELKTLLNQYLQAGVNQELQVPPTQVIRLDI